MRTKHVCTMSLDGSPKAKTVYRQSSSKIFFKQKWGIPKVYSFSSILAGTNLPLESAKYCYKGKTFQNSTSSAQAARNIN